jgi:Tol biopolymer transport system component
MRGVLVIIFTLFLVFSCCSINKSSDSRQNPQKSYLLYIQDGKLYKLDSEKGKSYEIYIGAELLKGISKIWLTPKTEALNQDLISNMKIDTVWLSPDMQKLLFFSNAKELFSEAKENSKLIIIVELFEEKNRKITERLTYTWIKVPELNVISGKWSPDSKKFAFIAKNIGEENVNLALEGKYFLSIMPNFGEQILITNIPSSQPISYKWSSNSSLIAFTVDKDNIKELYMVDYDGKNIKKISPDELNVNSFIWSPDEGNLLFTGRNDNNYSLYIASKGRTKLEKIKETQFNENIRAIPEICWLSEDKVLFIGNGTKRNTLSFYIINSDGSDSKEIETSFNGIYYLTKHPKKEILFFRGDIGLGRDIRRNIYTLNLEDLTISNLCPYEDKIIEFIISPSGNKLAFTAENKMFYVPNEIVKYLEVMNLSNQEFFSINRPLQCIKFHSWSPDEKALLTSQFILTEDGKEINLPENIIIVGWLLGEETRIGFSYLTLSGFYEVIVILVAFTIILLLLRRKLKTISTPIVFNVKL